jgi:hypothetical protein
LVWEGVARATTVSGAITSDQTWTLAGSPYVMTGDVTVGTGVTLTVQAGVSVVAAATDALAAGASPSLVELNVNGTLLVNGTAEAPVSFTSANASGGDDWYGVVVASGGAATIANASFAYANYGLWWHAGTLDVTDSSFDHDTYGVYVQGGTAILSGLTVTNSYTGIDAPGGAVVLSTSVLQGNSVGALTESMMWISSSTIDHNGDGLRLIPFSGPGLLQISNSLVTNNAGYGVYQTGSGGVLFDGVGLYGNGTDNATPGSSGTPSYCNPLYVSSDDLHLTSNSPYLTAAPGGQPYGALPYRGDATPGFYGVIRSNTTIPAAGSPHAIPGDIEVAPGVTLTLEPGATLSFANAADLMRCGDHAAQSELRVHGRLDAIGTSLAPITLTASGTLTNAAWAGLHLFSDAAPLTLSHFELAGAENAVQDDGSAPALFDHGSVHDSFTGLSAANLTLDSVVVHDTSAAVSLATGSITNLLAYSNTRAVEVTGGPAAIANATFSDDATAVAAPSGGVTVENSVLAHGNYALYGSGTVQYSDVWDFTEPFSASGGNNLFVDPGFVAEPGNWHLLAGSACIDAGTSTSAPDHDLEGTPRPLDGGSGVARWDLGAYEYAGATGTGGSGGTGGGSGGTLSTGGSGGTLSTGGSGGTLSAGGSGGTLSTGGSAGEGVGGTLSTGGSGGTLSTGGSAGQGAGGMLSAGGTLGSGALGGDAGASEGGGSGVSGEAGAPVISNAGAPNTGGSTTMPTGGMAGSAATGGSDNANAGEPGDGSGGTTGATGGGATGGATNGGNGTAAGGKSGNHGGGTNGGTSPSGAKAGASGSGHGAAGGSAGGTDNSGCGCRVEVSRASYGQFGWIFVALAFMRRRRSRRPSA